MEFQNYEKLSEMAKKAQEPLKAIAELNVKTLQGLEFIKPEELAKIHKPEELIEKQVKMAVGNSHKALEYMKKTLHIMENAMLDFVQESKKMAAVVAKK